jgi:hypothetical protein
LKNSIEHEVRITILDLIPEIIRKIIGSILLIFGTVLFLWAYFGDWGSGLEGIGALAFLMIGLSSIVWGLYLLMYRWLRWTLFDEERDLAKNLITNNRKQQIACSSCNQKLNIPFSYSGMISCPACGIYIELEEGIIQVEENPSDLVLSEG